MKYEILFEGPRRFRPRPSRGRDIGSRILLTRTGIQMHLKVENLLTNEKYVYQLIRVVWRSRVERTNHRSVYEPFSVLVGDLDVGDLAETRVVYVVKKSD